MRHMRLAHRFVDGIPDSIEEGVLYISIQFATAIHRCCCGCGLEVVTPLTPTDWKLIFDGVSVSLDPSIGNWSYPCQSHYWIDRNVVDWDRSWSRYEIDRGRKIDISAKERYFGERQTERGPAEESARDRATRERLRDKLKKWLWMK